MMELNIQPFKEPRGFIKILQWLFAICAFATTVDYSGKFGFTVKCENASMAGFPVYQRAEYPFNMDHKEFIVKNFSGSCPNQGTVSTDWPLIGNAQSEAVFFVFTGVISFLYATFLIGVYAFADKMYLGTKNALVADFFVTVALAVFWIAGASAWAHGISSVSTAMYARNWFVCPSGLTCTDYYYDSVSKLVISVLFGFINFVLWSGNIWFLYKETSDFFNGFWRGGGGQTNSQPSTGNTP